MKTMINKLESVLLLGSGGIKISQAGEFDYSGSQAVKALKEEGLKVILVNPNIATIQTNPDMADKVYLEPLDFKHVVKIIEKECPDSIMLSFGGQTALNLGLELEKKGVLEHYNIKVLGSSVETIKAAEDRGIFKNKLNEINIKTARSFVAQSTKDAIYFAKKIGFPLMLRSGFSLGGLGSSIIKNEQELKIKSNQTLNGASQILLEESLLGWSEFEYEIVRDSSGSALTICNMENFDPMGIHTGESIVVSPSQSLNNEEYHRLRKIAIQVANHFEIIGECNIQYAFNLKSSDYRVIEINPRLSRSSALASKATGYPLAFIAAKLALGYNLHELKNNLTKKTCAFFEPALDYIVVKIPRWDTHKLKNAERFIGTEMKSVGEVMAIGRSFPESLQKAIGMLNINSSDLSDYKCEAINVEKEIQFATDRRIFALYRFFKAGETVDRAHELSGINKWFLRHIYKIVLIEKKLRDHSLSLTRKILLEAKKMGFSDQSIAKFRHIKKDELRRLRISKGIIPVIKRLDTLAGEFEVQTNYLYFTYHGINNDIEASNKPAVLVLGSGPYSIGSSVEFDWCGVTTVKTLKKLGEYTIIVNSNPETVSTDYDESDRLYFEQLTFERIQDIIDFENLKGVIISVGGQIANNLVIPLSEIGAKILGTHPININKAENRALFSEMLNKLHVDQPRWESVSNLENARLFAEKVGYPILVRPSYVLSGSAMSLIHSEEDLYEYLQKAALVSPNHPVVVSDFIDNAKELEIDGVASNGKVVIYAITEHVENAGVHSGDATIVLPPQNIYLETVRKAKRITEKIVRALCISGPFNIQFIAKNNEIKVIECNLRASRSFPFVSKITGHDFIKISTEVVMGKYEKQKYNTLDLDYVGVKTSQFSYSRLKGANPVAHVEMSSTGEVGCIGFDLLDAFYKSWQATGVSVTRKKILLSIESHKREKLLSKINKLVHLKWDIFCTPGTFKYLREFGIKTTCVYKTTNKDDLSIENIITNKMVDIIINIPSNCVNKNNNSISDGFRIRRLAVDNHVPLITNLQISELILRSLIELYEKPIYVKSHNEFIQTKN